ncbi:hypothetical protein ACFL6U_24565 [Planctomycetota bacterium]
MNIKPPDHTLDHRRTVQLQRLERLTDVVYGIVLWRAFMLFPRPETTSLTLETFKVFWAAERGNMVVILLTVVVAILYWVQSNLLFGNMKATDGRHTAMSILQLFFLLLFLYAMRLGTELGNSMGTRAFESITAALMGIMSSMAWAYAMKQPHLLQPEVDDVYAQKLRDRTWAEPTTALITLPFAFFSPLLWELGWFIGYPIMRIIVRGIKRQ